MTESNETNMPRALCLACGQRPSATLPDWPALCTRCLDRAGRPVAPGDRVVCTVDESCSGMVARLDSESVIVVRTASGQDAHVPIQELVRITAAANRKPKTQ